MKLAEALQERADLNNKLSYLKTRIMNNVLVQEGEEPAEDPKKLMTEFDSAAARLEVLIRQINHTNAVTEIDGKTLTAMIAEKDCLSLRLNMYREAVNQASERISRYGRNEIRNVSYLDVPTTQKAADSLAKELRLLDNKLQSSNWTVELIED